MQKIGGTILTIAHVRYIKILTLLPGFRVKIAIFSRLHCLAIPKEKETKQRKMTRKPRSHVRILIYRTHGLMSKVENGVLKRYLKYLPSDKFKTRRIFLVEKVQNASRENIPKSIFEKFRPEEREKLVFFLIVWTVGLTERINFLIPYLLSGVVWRWLKGIMGRCAGGKRMSKFLRG